MKAPVILVVSLLVGLHYVGEQALAGAVQDNCIDLPQGKTEGDFICVADSHNPDKPYVLDGKKKNKKLVCCSYGDPIIRKTN